MMVALWAGYAHPRDLDGPYAQSPLKDWFKSLKSGRGPCCDGSDGRRVDDADWQSKGERYRVRVPLATGKLYVSSYR